MPDPQVAIEDVVKAIVTLELLRDVLPKAETTAVLTTLHTINRNARDINEQ